MSALPLRHRLRNLFQRRSIGRYGHIQEVQGVPFYEARQPWWARFTWGFIAADLLVTSTVTELAWTKSTSPPKTPGDAPALRPAWQRASLCLGHLTLGVGLATFLLIARSRVVRILHVFPPSGVGGGGGGGGGEAPSGIKQLLVAGAHTYGKRGAVVPFSRTRIQPGRDETEAIMRIEDVRGHWWIGLAGARLRGTPVSAARMREALLAEWGIRKSSRQGYDQSGGAGRWKGGPIMDNAA